MARSNVLAANKLYHALGAQERFRLALAAVGRGDDEELQRLIRTSPRQDISVTVTAFHRPFDTLAGLATFFLIHALISGRNIAIVAYANAAARVGVFLEGAGASEEEAERLFLTAQAEGAGVLVAMEDFCREIGVPVGDFMPLHSFLPAEAERLQQAVKGASPDQEKREELLTVAREKWLAAQENPDEH